MAFCIVNVGTNGYVTISERLNTSLNNVGYAGGRLIYSGRLPEGSPTHQETPYAFKIYAIEQALRLGYKQVLWLDSSLYPIRPLDDIQKYINDNGWFMFRTGYNLAQSVNDRTLEYARITRDEAETVTEYASGCVGLNFELPEAKELFNKWKQYMIDGQFKGSRSHDNQSDDLRFLFHRQDQSCLSLSMYTNGIGVELDAPAFCHYYGTPQTNETIFMIHGI
jgi:hypothetical protein